MKAQEEGAKGGREEGPVRVEEMGTAKEGMWGKMLPYS